MYALNCWHVPLSFLSELRSWKLYKLTFLVEKNWVVFVFPPFLGMKLCSSYLIAVLCAAECLLCVQVDQWIFPQKALRWGDLFLSREWTINRKGEVWDQWPVGMCQKRMHLAGLKLEPTSYKENCGFNAPGIHPGGCRGGRAVALENLKWAEQSHLPLRHTRRLYLWISLLCCVYKDATALQASSVQRKLHSCWISHGSGKWGRGA